MQDQAPKSLGLGRPSSGGATTESSVPGGPKDAESRADLDRYHRLHRSTVNGPGPRHAGQENSDESAPGVSVKSQIEAPARLSGENGESGTRRGDAAKRAVVDDWAGVDPAADPANAREPEPGEVLSLFEGDANAFYEAGSQYQLSKIGRQFIAGLLRHANEISAVTNQFVNSYKRLWGGDEAPSFICWGHNNRSALVRVPLYKPNKGQSARVEYRAIDSAANPYLAFSLLLAAGMKGIEEGYELPQEAEDDVWALTDSERRALGYNPLPASLDHAIEYMEESELVAETLGEQVFNYVLANKRSEWRDYRSQVTPYELRRNLEIL